MAHFDEYLFTAVFEGEFSDEQFDILCGDFGYVFSEGDGLTTGCGLVSAVSTDDANEQTLSIFENTGVDVDARLVEVSSILAADVH